MLNAATHESTITAKHRLISASQIREIFGITDMTVWRWVHDEGLDFPKPIYIGRRRYWRESDVMEWISSRPREPED